MRLCSNKGERGYGALQDILAQGKTAHVMLDGVEVHKAMMADDEDGVIVACKLEEKGHLTRNDQGEFATHELRGKVTIKIRDRS